MFETMLFFLMFILTLSLMTRHPFFVSLLLTMAALLLSVQMGMIVAKWPMFVTMLVFLGGMMVMFSYVASISCFDKLELKSNILIPLTASILFTSLISFPHKLVTSFSIFQEQLICFFPLIMYLLFSLILAIRVSLPFKGSMISSS